MFKKLKDKLAEEVKQPAQRFQQMAAAAQTAITSSSSSTSDTATDNFFSITEEDTPQNSPAHKPPSTASLSASKTSTPAPSVATTNNGIPSVSLNRTRKLSNSSVASDVSFRLPQFDSPAVYHLQSDLDTASEMEDTPISQQLDMVSKEQLHSAYKKALDRYQKYRGRYTEVARRYRDLERDNNKARAVLVETQDKALRRISELREQCTLEQQAKAHLEAALRLEMDEMQCVVKTLKTKLEVSGEADSTKNGNHESLISFEGDTDAANGNSEASAKILALEGLLAQEKLALKELGDQNESLKQQVRELQKREEENTILLAENKMAIHSELEQKENEVKTLRLEKEQLLASTTSLKAQLQTAAGKEAAADDQIKKLETIMNMANEDKRKVESKFVLLEKKILELETVNKAIASEKAKLQEITNAGAEKLKALEAENVGKSREEKEAATAELNDLKAKLESERTSAESTLNKLTTELNDLRAKLESETSEKINAEAKLEALTAELIDLKAKFTSERATSERRIEELSNEIKEKVNFKSKTEALTNELKELTTKLKNLETEKTTTSDEFEKVKTSSKEQTAKLEASIKQLQDQLKKAESDRKTAEDSVNKKLEKSQKKLKSAVEEKNTLKTENETSKSELKTTKQDLNKLQQQVATLTEELKNAKVVNENSESEAIKTLQESMKTTISAIEQKLVAAELELSVAIEAKEKVVKDRDAEMATFQERIETLTKEKEDSEQTQRQRVDELLDQVKGLQAEKQDNVAENTVLKAKIDNLKTEKRDLEKTLEREIREKSELKIQVTNILQEIGRLEDQLKEVKQSHSLIQSEKQTLEEKIEKIQKQHNDAKNKLEKEANNKWQARTKELETKLQAMEVESAQMADRNCTLEETNQRLVREVAEGETKHKLEKTEWNARLQELETVMAQMDELKNQLAESEKKTKAVSEQLTQCTGDHAKLFNEKELLDHQLRTLQDDCETKEKEKLCLLDNHKCLEDKFKDTDQQKQQLEVTCDDLRQNLEAVRQENTALLSAKAELTADIDPMREKIADLEKTKDYLDAKVAALREKLTLTEGENLKFTNEIEKLNSKSHSRLRELEDALKHTNDEKQTLKESLSKNATDIEKKMQNYEEIKIENEYLNTLVKQLESDCQKAGDAKTAADEELKQTKARLEKDINELKTRVQQSETTLEGKDAEIRKLINDFVESENELKRQLTAVKRERDSLNTELEGNRIIIKDLNGDLEKIQLEANTSKKLSETAAAECEAAKLRVKELEVELQERSVQVSATNELESSKREFMATELQQLKTDREELGKRNEELLSQLAVLQTSYDKLTQGQQQPNQPDNRAEIGALTVEVEQLNRKNREIADENEKLQSQLEQVQATAGEASTSDAAAKENQSLKDQLKKIMHEVHDVSNRNQFLEQQCENFLILEQSNERLKLANEKLSRQLDETLVSLHHTEGMAANTEFEYLRNILFQYLTDSVNSNSTTLVKVIAAVLKFSPQQTQVVLEKEAQRHSLLGTFNKLL